MQTLRSCRFAVLLLPLLLGGCVKWHPVPMSPQQLLAVEKPSRVRVTDAEGLRSVLTDPVIQGDSILGTDEAGTPRSAPLAEVFLEVQRLEVGKTIGLGVVVVYLLAAAACQC